MQFPESWLREFCNPSLTTQQLADTLTMAGLEVEELEPVAPPFTKIVIGEIKEAVQHPNADRLRVCQVDAGQGGLLTIVCGAPNARVGIKVPCALVGAALPPGDDGKPFEIRLGQLRGVESQGMLCSAKELQISEESNGLLELGDDAVVGRNIREQLGLNEPVWVQLWIFVQQIVTFDWGKSWATNESVASLFATRMPATLTVMVPILILDTLLSIPIAIGVAILSTSSGLLTDRQASQKGVGGEVLAYVW